MIKELVYLTYQTFPAETANTIQTISNIKYFVKNEVNVDLYFPLRERQSDGDINKLKSYYSFSEDFNSLSANTKLAFALSISARSSCKPI